MSTPGRLVDELLKVDPELHVKVETPSCDRMVAVKDQSQLCGEFLEWLMGRYTLCRPPTQIRSSHYVVARIDIEALLADYFDVDLEEVEREKRALIDALRGSRV